MIFVRNHITQTNNNGIRIIMAQSEPDDKKKVQDLKIVVYFDIPCGERVLYATRVKKVSVKIMRNDVCEVVSSVLRMLTDPFILYLLLL